ncbi:type II toxin-antitoxin system HicA family toxin [Rhodopseudomonas palustris]|uniref:type II toxin-antitoxin system HicA family toxin n=1 Tax=Rhodopseudomonas palustris TaxID=1076 RepID=UPI002ACED7BE|nr:type II toxin-antitoxin system HicA family toxin [Rhodopseudomonas palustris]WQH01100.1 type II toxin-antitoxin system HicA family toxin [Rhodopseudomonas palustris]
MKLSRKHQVILDAIFATPVCAGIVWNDVEALFRACGAEISEGSGSRVRVVLNGVRAVFHRPHPQKETDKGAVKSVRRFLIESGIEP